MRQFRPQDTVDFVVIGSGAAGGIMAKQLSTAGFSVVVLEQGGCAFRLVPAEQPEVGGGSASEQILDESECDHQQHEPHADGYPGPPCTDASQ